MDPEVAPWLSPLALAQLVHSQEQMIRVLAWQQGGGKARDYPKPIPAPWIDDADTTKIGVDPVPWDEMTSWLGWEAQMARSDIDE